MWSVRILLAPTEALERDLERQRDGQRVGFRDRGQRVGLREKLIYIMHWQSNCPHKLG